jgi:FixJ family two-component response regulator
MTNKEATIFVIDDDHSVRKSLILYLKAAEYNVESFGSSEEYLAREPYDGTGCLILDVNLGGKTGLQLQEELIQLDSHLPVIFITGYGDVHMSVKALKNGAVNFLEKPFDVGELLRSVKEALELSQELLIEKKEYQKANKLIDSLTRRETEILKYLITGALNKQIASKLDIAEHTVKIHRQSICHKLEVKSVPDIIRIAEKAGIIRK